MSEAAAPLLTVAGITKNFGATRALKGVDLTLARGEVLALIGENGAGKSTLMKVLSGAHPADTGTMTFEGAPYAPRGPLHARSLGVCMIYQELALAPHLSAMENILLGIEPTRGPLMDWRETRAIARRALDEVGLPHLDPATLVEDLSIAEQQLVEIARAVAVGCKVLVLDEPTSSLTQKDVQALFALVRRLRAKGVAIVYISHALEEIEALCDRFTVLRDGETVGHGIAGQVPTHDIIALMVGRAVEDLYPRSPRHAAEPALELRALAGKKSPRSASLTLHRGEVVGIAGLIGSGRTETLRALFGLDAVASGEIRIHGNLTPPAGPADRWARGLGLVSEDRKTEGLAQNLSIAENLTLSRLEGLGPWRFVLPSRQDAAAAPWIRDFPIKCQGGHQPVEALSGGNQQKVAIARLLHHDCDVLLLDEPTRGIDVGSKAQIYAWIDKLALGDPAAGRPPKAVLVVSSYLPELLGICDRIAVMTRGVLGEARPVAEWTEHSLMLAATGQDQRG
ncbi:MAG: sugar ABC transporter ATP-binding protein [Opitutaceae bacterium]|jgi:ribose transport system ATP-binding protein|nr:sugar ABC transporter ATP-binding protein [Opitutaceae bacterium]